MNVSTLNIRHATDLSMRLDTAFDHVGGRRRKAAKVTIRSLATRTPRGSWRIQTVVTVERDRTRTIPSWIDQVADELVSGVIVEEPRMLYRSGDAQSAIVDQHRRVLTRARNGMPADFFPAYPR